MKKVNGHSWSGSTIVFVFSNFNNFYFSFCFLISFYGNFFIFLRSWVLFITVPDDFPQPKNFMMQLRSFSPPSTDEGYALIMLRLFLVEWVTTEEFEVTFFLCSSCVEGSECTVLPPLVSWIWMWILFSSSFVGYFFNSSIASLNDFYFGIVFFLSISVPPLLYSG